MFCRKCGYQMLEGATVCESCGYRVQPAVFCHKCASELPLNSNVCGNCGTKSIAGKSATDWLPIALPFVAYIFYIFGGFYRYIRFDAVQETYIYEMPYVAFGDFAALALSIFSLIWAAAKVPKTRMALKVIGLILSGITLFLAIDWIVLALF